MFFLPNHRPVFTPFLGRCGFRRFSPGSAVDGDVSSFTACGHHRLRDRLLQLVAESLVLGERPQRRLEDGGEWRPLGGGGELEVIESFTK